MPIQTRLERIFDASRHIDPVFLDSPTLSSDTLDAALGCHLVAKDETANPIGSFKGRGTELFAALALWAGEPLVCASAGNFGQGLARAASRTPSSRKGSRPPICINVGGRPCRSACTGECRGSSTSGCPADR